MLCWKAVEDEEADDVGQTVCQCVYYSYLLHVVIMISSLADEWRNVGHQILSTRQRSKDRFSGLRYIYSVVAVS